MMKAKEEEMERREKQWKEKVDALEETVRALIKRVESLEETRTRLSLDDDDNLVLDDDVEGVEGGGNGARDRSPVRGVENSGGVRSRTSSRPTRRSSGIGLRANVNTSEEQVKMGTFRLSDI